MRAKISLLARLLFMMTLGILGGAFGVLAQDGAEIPDRIDHISDYAEIYTEQDEQELNTVLQALGESEGLEIDILAIESTGEMTIEEFGDAVQREWSISANENLKRHLLIIIAVEDGRYNLVTTQGLERFLPDSELTRINNEVIVPALENEPVEVAMTAGIEAMIASYREAVESDTPVHTPSGPRVMGFSDFMGILLVIGGVAVLLLINSLL